MRKTVAALAGLLSLGVSANTVCAQDAPIEAQIVDALNKTFGVHPGLRANHAKGIVAEGSFKASAEAAEISKAAIFSGADIPLTVRFSGLGAKTALQVAGTIAPPTVMVGEGLPSTGWLLNTASPGWAGLR